MVQLNAISGVVLPGFKPRRNAFGGLFQRCFDAFMDWAA
jgi:hypothetical protein